MKLMNYQNRRDIYNKRRKLVIVALTIGFGLVIFLRPPQKQIVMVETKSYSQKVDEFISEINFGISKPEMDLMARLTLAEAESEDETTMRLVIDTMLNRMNDTQFPNNMTEVIYQQNAYGSMWNGRFEMSDLRDDILQLVKEEIVSRLDSQVIYYNNTSYPKYGIPMYKQGNLYFSQAD